MSTTSMRAAYRTKYGNPDLLQVKELAIPSVAPKQILIKVFASTVNRTDCGILTGKPFPIRFFAGLFTPYPTTGTDFAGEVIAIGTDITKYSIGDRIWGLEDNGLSSHAEYMVIKESAAINLIPENISYDIAAASAEGTHYALNILKHVKAKKGDKILVNGATGAIGSALIQLIRTELPQVHLTVVCAAEHFDKVEALKPDRIIDYKRCDFTKEGLSYHYILDAVGKSLYRKCKPILEEGGIYISTELGEGIENLYLPLTTKFSGSKRVKFPLPYDKQGSINRMTKLLAEGRFTPMMDRTYKLDEIREAFEYVMTGQKTGNVVISPQLTVNSQQQKE